MPFVHDQSQKRTHRKHNRSLSTTLVDPPPSYVSSRRHGPSKYCVEIAKITDDKDCSKTPQLADFAWMVDRLPAHVIKNWVPIVYQFQTGQA